MSIKFWNYTFDPELSQTALSVVVNSSDETDWAVSIVFEPKKALENMYFYLESYLTTSGSKWRQRKNKIIDMKVNMCEFFTKTRGGGITSISNIASMFLMNTLQRYSKLPKECPVAIDTYTVNNLTLAGLTLPFLQFLPTQFDGFVDVSLRTRENEQLKTIVASSYYGSYKNVQF